MSGHHPNQPPRGWNRGGPTSPIHYRPPSPWAPSPPPIISGPRRSRHSPLRGSPLSSATISPRSTPMSPSFGASPGAGVRGSRGPQIPCPRPRWPGPPQVSPMPHQRSSSPQLFQRVSASPPPIIATGMNGPKPFRPPPYSPVSSNSYSRGSPVMCSTPPEYLYSGAPYENAQYAVGVPLEPPQPKSYIIYDDEEEQGPSTAEIIANQSQDYVDEKLAEYQMTITQLQEEQERVQKKTFVNWINSYLSKRIPPLRINDLITDLSDGTKLLALLEVLSGEKLPVERSRVLRRPHFLSNVNTALQFLASKRIKLVNINPADLVDGRPPVVLGLIWTIILYFQIEENSRALEYLGHGMSGSVSSLDSLTAAPANSAASDLKAEKWKQGARKTLLTWVTNALPKDCGIDVRDFGASWRDGIAFLALIDSIKANLINLAEMRKTSNKHRLETAFDVAETKLGIARLLDPEDVDVDKPDEKSIMTYVAQFLHKYPEPKRTGQDGVSALQQEYDELLEWLLEKTSIYEEMIHSNSFPRDFGEYLVAKCEMDTKYPSYNKLKNIVESQNSMITITQASWENTDKLWKKLELQLLYWLWMLDASLPGDFGIVGKWLSEAEKLLYADEIPSVMNEETAALISAKLEQHKQFFADYEQILELFERVKHSNYANQVPMEQLRHLEKRLYDIGPKATQRRIRLKFLEHKCCLIAFLNLVENKLRMWNIKYGREDQVHQMLEQYKNFVSRNKIFQEFGKAFMDMQQVIEEYKRDGNITRSDYYAIDKFMGETEKRWKGVSMELRCCQSMLEEVVANWKRWNTHSDDFEGWLCRAEEKLHDTEDERLDFFQDISVWKDKHQLLGEACNFLVATCTTEIGEGLRSKFLNLSSRFDHLFANTKQYMHAGDIIRNRQEYRYGAEQLSKWIKKSEDILNKQPIGTTEQIKAYGEELQKLAAEVEDVDEIFKNTSRIIQSLIQDLSRDDVDKMMNTLKNQKESLVRIRAQIPIKLHLFHQLLIQHEALDQGQKEVHQWLNEGEEVLQSLSLSGGKDQIQEQQTRHRNYFSRTLYYKSMLDSKNKVFQNILKSVQADKSIDTSEAVEKMKQLNDRFGYVTQNAQQCENRLKESARCWHNFKESERAVSEWLHKAEMLLSERHVTDSKQTVQSQKMFFENINEKWMNDLVQTAQDLIKSIPSGDHKPIIEVVENLQKKWKEILSAAPLHLMRLDFRLDESSFYHYMKDIEKEILFEKQALNKNEDIDTILKRNKEYFKTKGTVIQVEKCLENMQRISTTYTQYDKIDQSIASSFREAELQWENVAERIEEMRKTLQQIPAQWDYYHQKFVEMVSWMDSVDKSLKSIINEVNSMDEFEKEKIVFQNICHEADAKREEMKWLVKTLDSLLPYATETEVEAEQRSLEALIARYKNLIPTIEVTMVKTEVFSKCYTYRREVHEVVSLLNKVKDQTVNAPAPDSLEKVNRMIQDQQYAISQLDHQRTHIMSMLQRGRDLSKDIHAPQFVSNEVKALESGWNDAYNETVDKLRILRDTQNVWSEFQDQKLDILNILGNAETELRSITPLQTDPKNVSSDLKNKRDLNIALQQASHEKIIKLHELCSELIPLADQAKKPILEKEVTEIEKKFFNTMEHVKDRVGYLEGYSAKWNNYKARLAELQAWAEQVAPQHIEVLQSQDLSPEERVAKANALQGMLSEKMRQLDILASDASELAPKEGNIKEAKRLKGDVHKLQETLSNLNRNVEQKSQSVKKDLINWQKYQSGIEEIKPWIEESEVKINFITSKPASLQEAVLLQQQAKQFEQQSENQLKKLHNVEMISSQMTCKTNAPDELDAIQSRWVSVNENAKQVTNKYDRLVMGWQSFEADADRLEKWVDDNELSLENRPDVVNSPHIDKLEKELFKLKSFNNEISEQQAKLVSLMQSSDQINLNLSPDGSNTVKDRVNLIKGKLTKLSEIARGKVNDVSDAIMARQEFNAQMANFGNWMDQLRMQVAKVEEINTDRVEPSLQMVHALLQTHSDKKPVFNAIYDEILSLSSKASPDEAIALNDAYSTLMTQYQAIENNLHAKREVLEKLSELTGWKNETDSNISHIKHQLDKADKLEAPKLAIVLSEIEQISKTITYWKQEAKYIDDAAVIHLKDTPSRKPINALQLVNDVENKLELLRSKSQGQMQTLNKIEERKNHFNKLQNQQVTHLTQSRQKLEEILRVTPNFNNIDEIISDLVALNEMMQQHSAFRDKVHDEGNILMKEDISSMPAIQETVLVLDKEWDGLHQELGDRIQKYSIISQGLKDYAEARDRFDKQIKKTKGLHDSIPSKPFGEQQLLQTADKSKRALEQIKKAKSNLDDLDRKGNFLLKQFDAMPNDIATELEECHKTWHKLYELIAKHALLYETEAVILNHIEESKNEILPWLSETNQSLCDAADNTLEIEYGPIRLNKYQTELPSYLGIKNDIFEKITELTKMNKDAPIDSLENLKEELNLEFEEVQKNADRLQSIVASFSQQEKNLRQEIKANGEAVMKLREALIKCDDMSGDNKKIMERHQCCKALKEQLFDRRNDLDNLRTRVDELKTIYPTLSESIIPKELSNVQKRFESVVTHGNKIEATLLQFLKKFHLDKVTILERMIATQTEKMSWCIPESSSDKYNLEVKKSSLNDVQKGIAECETRKKDVAQSLAMLNQIDSLTNLAAFHQQIRKIDKDLEDLKTKFEQTKLILDKNVDLWNQHEQNIDSVTTWLKEIENKIKSEAAGQIDLDKIDQKLIDLENHAQEVIRYKPTIDKLEETSKQLMATQSEARIAQFVGHLKTRYVGVSKNILNLLDRVKEMKETYNLFRESAKQCENWIHDAKMEFNELARMGSPGSGPTSEQLELVKKFVKNLETGQIFLSKATDAGESLYSGIIPENREKIRNELRKLRENFDDVHDEGNSLLSQVESVLLQKTSIEESYSQVKKLLNESKSKFSSQAKLFATLAEKKAALQKCKSQLQDTNLHRSALKQLQDKVSSLSDEEAEQRVGNSIKEYDVLNKNLQDRIFVLENQVTNHEAYDQIIEKAQDWLSAIRTEAFEILNETTFEKDGAEEKLIVVQNIILQKLEGKKIFSACNRQLQTVLQQIHAKGHPLLINSYEILYKNWEEFIRLCENSQSKLNQLCVKWDEFDNVIEGLDAWLRQTENIVRDQSLKSTWEKKDEHLNRLKAVDLQIAAKAPEIASIVEQGHEIENETDLNLRVSRLNTRYQTLKNLCKENIGRYEMYTKEHKTFNTDYDKFKTMLDADIVEIQNNGEVVGDLSVLQQRQNKVREISDKRANDSSSFEALIDRGERLYTHTSPDGREIIRQQIRNLRNSWDNFTDDLNSTAQKLDQCLLQFGEFTTAQEQLTKWLKDVEKSMQIHTELKPTLQEKRAQLQNHKLMHQEILTHNALVDSVCDKAQQLVDQTKDSSLNVYLESIKNLFTNIVSKSQELLNNLKDCVQTHHSYNIQLANLKSWLATEKQKLLECDDTTGEKSDINRRLNNLQILKKNQEQGNKLLSEVVEQFQLVKNGTSTKGIEFLSKELDDIQRSFDNHYQEIDAIILKQQSTLQQWHDLEKKLDELTKWCRATETIFREQQLQSTYAEKLKQLNLFKDHRTKIQQHQKNIDAFMDQAHSLLNNSGAERLKTLISQLTNRYQLLQVLSKEVVNRWQTLVDDHRGYEDKLEEVIAWISPLEKQVDVAIKDDSGKSAASNLLQVFLNEKERAENLLSTLTMFGEKALPETSTQGREKIRQDLRNIRDRWDHLDQVIQNLRKRQEMQTMQWSSYHEILQQTLAWLETIEHVLEQEHPSTWTSPQEIRSKIFKYKATLQEIMSHKRIIEAVTEKANVLLQSGPISNANEIESTIKSVNERYEKLGAKANELLSKLEAAVDVFQQFTDLQKSLQDYQKNLWDRLSAYSDYSGSKTVLQSRLAKVIEIQDSFPEAALKFQTLSDHIDTRTSVIPVRCKEAMARDLTNLNVDFERFVSALNDVKSALQNRLQQWTDYEMNLDRLITWLNDAENTLKNYITKSTLEEKQEQLNRFQALIVSLRQNETEFDKITDESSELIQSSGETRISMNVQQVTSRFQSIQAAAKEIVKKCEQAVMDHQQFNEKYKQCSNWIASAQDKYNKCSDISQIGSRQDLLDNNKSIKELLMQQSNATLLLNNTVELGEKLYTTTALEGREAIRTQLQELTQALEQLYDNINSVSRLLQSKLSKWSGFEECAEKLQMWLGEVEKQLGADIQLKTTLDEKRNQLQTYRDILGDIQNHQTDIINLKDITENLPERNENIEKRLKNITEQYGKLQKRIYDFVEKYESYVSHHQQYCKAVMDTQEFIEATNNTIDLWGDLELERVSLSTNLDRLKNLQSTLGDESSRIEEIRVLGEKVIPGTIQSGQINIQSQIDCSQQEWEGLLSLIQSTIESIENKLQQWDDYEKLRDQCFIWLRDTDNKLHAVDLKATNQEKKDQLEVLKSIQGEVRAKELEIDNVSEKAQLLHRGLASSRYSQTSDLIPKYQQISHKVKDLNLRWQQYVTSHQEFDNQMTECTQWLDDIKEKLEYCSDLSATSQKDLEAKLATIQDLLLLKDEGFAKVQSIVELAQVVLANTAPQGHEPINKSLAKLQEDWSKLALKMVDIKTNLGESINQWSGFLEQVQNVNKTVEWLDSILKELAEYQTTMTEKRAQLERIKNTDEKVRLEKIDVDTLKAKAAEMLASGQQSQAAYQAQQILNKFDELSDNVRKLLQDREEQYRDHRLYKEAYDELLAWISRVREKLPSMKQRSLSDKLAIENAVAPLDALLNKQAQGELLVERLEHTGEVVLASTSPQGQEMIRNDIRALKENFDGLYREIKQQKTQFESTLREWRDYKEEYERLSEWLQQIDILVKNLKLNLSSTIEDKKRQVDDMGSILDRLIKGQSDIDKFNASASSLLSSHLDTYVNNQLRHLNSRYQVQVNLAKDVLKKVENNYEQHKEFNSNLTKARDWIENAKEIIRKSSESSSANSKEVLQQRLGQIQNLIRRREDGQSLVHTTVNNGEKVLRSTRSDGKELINNQIKELQNDWDRLVKKLSTAKVHLETSLLQWADYSSSYSQLQQWITDREAKLQQVCEQKVAKSKIGQPSLSSGLSERKANLRQTNNIVQDIVSFEPMIQSVTSKASDLMQASPASEISTKYESLSKQAKDLYEKQREAVEQHQSLIDAENEFAQWLRDAKERLSKCCEPTGDKESLSSKLNQLKILDNEMEVGQKKLEKTLEFGEIAVNHSEPEDKLLIEEAVAFLQDEFDTYVETLKSSKNLLEVGIIKWTDYEDQYSEALEWLTKTEGLVQSYNKLQDSLEDKKNVLEEFQGHLQTLFDWQKELDRLNMRAQTLLETCADTRISNAVTQLTTKYNALLSLAKEIMRRLELHYQEHQQHHSLYEECQYWIEKTREKLKDCEDVPSSLSEVQIKLNTVKSIRQGFEQGQNKLRYAMELKEKVIMNTEMNGAAKIQEDTETLKLDFDKLLIDINEIRQKLTNRATQLEDIFKQYKMLTEWLVEIEPSIHVIDSYYNDLSEKRSSLEKCKGVQRDIISHGEIVQKIKVRLTQDSNLNPRDFEDGLKRFENVQEIVGINIEKLECEVNNHEKYKQAYNEIYEWIRKTRMEIQQCSDSHGEKNQVLDKLTKLRDIDLSVPEGKILVENAVELSKAVLDTSGNEGQDSIRQEIKQLRTDWDSVQSMSKDAHESLNACITAWNDFNSKYEKINKWIEENTERVRRENLMENKTPEDHIRCKKILDEIVAEQENVEELNDACEVLMEHSACVRVRDKTVETQAMYTKLLTSAQGLLAKVEKNLSDHTEFLNYKNEMDKWLSKANEILENCGGYGNEVQTRHKLELINTLSNRISEGHHLLGLVQEAFNKAIDMTPEDKQVKLRESMASLRTAWDKFTLNVQEIAVQLKSAVTRWEDYIDSRERMKRWLTDTENILKSSLDSRGELSEMKTMLERYKHIQADITLKASDLKHLHNEAKELSSWYHGAAEIDEINQLQARWDKLNINSLARIKDFENEVNDYNLYHQKLQEAEKWLLQVSFQLMAHNSLYITNRKQTQEQINQHEMLLDEIQKYQTNLDDLRSKGQCQIERYETTTPTIRNTIEIQLKNIQESYNSLLQTSLQIKNRLHESLAKFQEYENTLDKIMKNLDEYKPIIASELDKPPISLDTAESKLQCAQMLHSKLQGEKSCLALAVQACEAATASISRPSSPLETAMQPIPEKELKVREKLEDLIDEVQSHLSSLSITVKELQAQQKQRAELQDWIKKQQAQVTDWSSRPSKLRPEASKQEIVAMNDLLNAIGDKRSQLLTEMTGSFGDDDTADIEQELDKLEMDLMDTIAKKTAGQNVIDIYRHSLQDMHSWFDNLIKRMDVLDKGSGLNCVQKLSAINEIKNDFHTNGPNKLADLKQKAHNVNEQVSNLDGQQVDEQIKSVERRYNDISKRIDRKAQILDVTNRGVENAKNEIEQIQNWVNQQITNLQQPQNIGYDSKSAEARIQKLKALGKESDAKQALTETLERRIANMQNELEPLEQTKIETDIRNLAAAQKQLSALLKNEINSTSEAAQERKKMEVDVERAKSWLKAKLTEVRKQPSFLPLLSAAIEDELEKNKKHERDIKEFKEGVMKDVIRQGNHILKDCPEEEKEHLQKILNDINDDYKTLKEECDSRSKLLSDLLGGRKLFENDVVKLNTWLNMADSSASVELRTTNIPILEEQIIKYVTLDKESNEMASLLASIIEQSKAIIPTLSNADKHKLNDQIKSLKDKHARITNIIKNKLKSLQEHIQRYKDSKAKLAECVQFLGSVQQEIRELKKPVGSKIEDVQGLLNSYEKILSDLKDSKSKMSDLQGENLPDLQNIMSQQDDMIKLIEDQLAHLRQLLLLREQFIAIINEIVAFIIKYTTVITEIEKSPETIEEKIKQYDEVIVRIQECEALLASASDKGQKIASEGNAADRNSITEQLQSLKQQLQNLRKQVESYRQKHELTLAEHKKMAADLSDVLDWLHSNEAMAKSRPLLDRDPDCAEREIQKHKKFSENVKKHLAQIKQISDQSQHEIGMPSSLIDMISEGRSLLATLPDELDERRVYLENSKQHRLDYMHLVSKFNDWIHEAETRLQNGKHGVDYANIQSDLEEHKAFFKSEQSIKDLVTKQIQMAADKIWPSLNSIEQEELSRELQHHTQVLKNTINSAKSQHTQLEQDAETWKDYCVLLEKVKVIMARMQFNDDPVTNLAGLHFNMQKITHALNDIQSHQGELDILNEKAREILRQADPPNRLTIEKQNSDINLQWSELIDNLENRRETLTNLAQHWEDLDSKINWFDGQLSRFEERSKHIDHVVRSRRHLDDTKHVIQELRTDCEELHTKEQEITSISKLIILFLTEVHKSSADKLQDRLAHLRIQLKTLTDNLNEKDIKTNRDIEEIEDVFRQISDLQDKIHTLLEELGGVYVYDQNQNQIEITLNKLRKSIDELSGHSKTIIKETIEKYNQQQNLVPSDITQDTQSLELLTEQLNSAMEEKNREFKKAKTVRTDYLAGVDTIQSWLQNSELRIQDRTMEPLQLKETLNKIQHEIGGMQDRLDGVRQNGQLIIEKSRNDDEKALIQSTIDQLTQQLSQVRSWLDEKKQQVGDSMDAWTRFINMYQMVMNWAGEKKTFVGQPMKITTLLEARQKQNDYANAVKSIKPVVKNLSEMDKELELIAQVSAVGDLRSKLTEAEDAKVEVEAILLERNALLQETAEEWEQCEKKLKEVRTWIDKTKTGLESPQHKKKSLRDQLGLNEKYVADISIQKTKITMSVEKLQVHFRSGIGGDTNIVETAKSIVHDLDAFNNIIKTRTHSLEETLTQLEDYQQQTQTLRQKILHEEQQLRSVMAPTYMPHDRDRAITEQQACQERVKLLQAKINARNERIKLLIKRGTPDDDPLLIT